MARVSGEANQPALDESNKLKEKQSQLEVPSRSSSHAIHQPSPTSTALTGVTASDPAESIGKDSKGSISGKRRRQSATSSKHSLETRPVAANNVAQPGQGDESKDIATTQKPKKKGPVSRFLAVLNCCSVPETANSVGTEDPLVPSKKSNKLQPTRTRQSTPSKQGPNVIGSSAVESEKPSNEKPSVVHDMEKTEPLAESKRPDEATVAPIPIINTAPDIKTESSNPDIGGSELGGNNQEQPTPVISETTGQSESRNMATQAPLQDAGSGVAAESLAPVASTTTEPAISDRTPLQVQQDTDIEMTDAPPPMPSTEVPKQEPINKEPITTDSGLPPPPPLVPREAQSALPAPPTQDTTVLAPTEKQQWLLPPIQPRFQGKKCLVLDLDETLVHSSFKVIFKINPLYSMVQGTDNVKQILHQADFTIPVEIEGQYHNVYVIKRPGVDQFMKRVGELYEVVVFTASVSKVCSHSSFLFHH